MKSNKYILLLTMLLGIIYANAQPSLPLPSVTRTSTSITTPNGSTVTVLEWVSGEWSQANKDTLKNAWMRYYGNRITFEAEATCKYNCHAWAWAGGTTYWMNSPQEQKYFSTTDHSYYGTTYNTAFAQKVWFGNADHSAITTSTNGYYSSKWGVSPRFKHTHNDSPYYPATLTYYSRHLIIPPANTGVALGEVIYDGAMFILTNPTGTVTWDISGPFTYSTYGGAHKAIITKTSSSGSGTLTAKINGTAQASYPLVAINTQISGPSSVNNGGSNFLYYLPQTGDTYYWENDGVLIMSSYNNGTDVFFDAPILYPPERDYIYCTVMLNGVPNYFSKRVDIK